MKTLSVFFSSLFVSALLFTSCQKGDQGVQGASGTTGAAGATGTAGATGAAGNTILSGDVAPSDTLGRIGDFYLELDNSELYGPKSAAGWGAGVSLAGQTGAQGNSGAQGPAGVGAQVDTFTVFTAEWSVGGQAFAQFDNNEAYAYSAKQVVRYNNIISQGILDSGMVLVSFTPDSAFNPNQWLSLPYTILGYDAANSKVVNYNWSYLTDINKVTLQFYLTPTVTGYYPDVTNFTVPDAHFKVVVIPAAVAQQIDAVTNKKFNSKGRVITL
jgi:hypothetical protein